MDTNSTEILAITDALADLDQRIKTLKLSIWLGGEPTFTDRFAQTAEWIGEAIGGNKELKARALAAGLLAAFPGGLILRTIGRQYPGEPTPRWNLGILAHRNGDLLWNGPPDPVLVQDSSDRQPDLDLLRATIANNLQEQGWITQYTNSSTVPGTRLLARSDGEPIISEKLQSTPVNSPSIHSIPIPDTGLCDALAEHGYYLLKFHLQQQDTNYWPTIELPSINDPYQYQILLGAIADAARSLKLTALILQGYPPPTSRHWHWSTVTPDPAVIEISLTPTASLVELFNICTQLFAAADTCGLAPYRLHYNGRETDSGGGGQLTIGGPTPEASPFFAEPRLLPRLIRYFNHHPALSYWFAGDFLGSGSQAPRADEGTRERWLELAVALEQLEHHVFPDPSLLWHSLAPLLVDVSGNSHRSELNVEKLWNPYLGTRGFLGLVEFRPFRMTIDAAAFVARAALLRAIIARLMVQPFTLPLIDWGDKLHTQFALPYNLVTDLHTVLADLNVHGFGLDSVLTQILTDNGRREFGHAEWQGLHITVSSALEFWPLIGDTNAQVTSDSRLVDASTSRIELRINNPNSLSIKDLQLQVNGLKVPLYPAPDTPNVYLTGIRYRSFKPNIGLHPELPAISEVNIILSLPNIATACSLTLHEWKPEGGGYPGLPQDITTARQRRRDRLVINELASDALPLAKEPPPSALTAFCCDLRRIASS